MLSAVKGAQWCATVQFHAHHEVLFKLLQFGGAASVLEQMNQVAEVTVQILRLSPDFELQASAVFQSRASS